MRELELIPALFVDTHLWQFSVGCRMAGSLRENQILPTC